MLLSIIIYIIGTFYFLFCYAKDIIKQKEKFEIMFLLGLLFWPIFVLYIIITEIISFFKK